ncbi:hypothetical protein BZG06_11575 [Salinivibrio kushneri]|uniref:Lycopene cyclase domain-containing protein n=1 Tax=Salinivibrio kushneri TaxID=1908198 RepID=A0AB36KB90_9GAMM|nr:hypothetical protein BZG06_11575 [Salinivibrio kushneri]OOE45362.1 hypothetical protein BZG09_04125 [Salinivibrio kushneri]OOE64637.1 hypothetical protein BZG19_14320 [Salinivibrio kushneri]
MIEKSIFVLTSIVFVYFLKRFNASPSEKIVFFSKYALMLISAGQYMSIFFYGGKVKRGYGAGDILFFNDTIVDALQLPDYIQFFALAVALYLCVFCHPKHRKDT